MVLQVPRTTGGTGAAPAPPTNKALDLLSEVAASEAVINDRATSSGAALAPLFMRASGAMFSTPGAVERSNGKGEGDDINDGEATTQFVHFDLQG